MVKKCIGLPGAPPDTWLVRYLSPTMRCISLAVFRSLFRFRKKKGSTTANASVNNPTETPVARLMNRGENTFCIYKAMK